MDPERWTHVDRLLQSALDRPAVERDVFLRSACGGDAQLEAELRSLLAAHDRAGGFLGDPAMDLAARQLTSGDTDSQDGADPLIGRCLGPEPLRARGANSLGVEPSGDLQGL